MTKNLGRSSRTSLPELVPECQQCSACCFSELERYVSVTGNDYSRLGQDAPVYVQFIGNRAFMRMSDGHCAALSLDATSCRSTCQVYENRPQTCRDLERGSPSCLGERHAKTERVFFHLRILSQ